MARTWSALCTWLVLLAVLYQVTDAEDCSCRAAPPQKNAPPLLFCSWYHKASCCLPAHDADMNDKFLAFIEAGPACEKFNNPAKLFLAMAFCYACDPDEPLHFTAPLNTAFFTAEKTAKICTSLTDEIAPRAFSDCGLMLPDDRETSCSPNSPVAPESVWSDCQDGEYVCFSQSEKSWVCSETPCSAEDTPLGFANAPCNSTQATCSGTLQFLNDNRAAKPPNYEEYPVEIVDEAQCILETGNATLCRCLRPALSRGLRTDRDILLGIIVLLGSILII
ncbi:hypothetical protein Poli38472_002549 [Pythium oligandrum]|uniref:Folate receptor-like domain-containing protein n=1 Tax=Pythium oligandrum TaxID=41045 RepID=A0A8K1CJK4_PYTOL|nr:hypothetical protein Poli38472_002549 [Pythium oligandrum]|eukprot:TMW63608.1 hypothetical protein Poli38472_002549 [Pythium oligandrum]